jgi:hypothetical protein
MIMSTRPDARPAAASRILPLLIVIAIAVVGIVIGGSIVHHRVSQANDAIQAMQARNKLATAAADAIHSATSNEKNAMLATDKDNLDEFATGWVTAVDHLKEDLAGLEQSARSPAETQAIETIEAALQAYMKAGEAMYQLKLSNDTDEAIAMSNATAQQARDRVINLIRDQVDESNEDIGLYEGKIDQMIVFSIIGLCGTFIMVGWVVLRRVFLTYTPRRHRSRRS